MGMCDICARVGEGTYISSSQMQEAVANGFNPFKLSLVPWESGDTEFESWKDVVGQDVSDWNLCGNCFAGIRAYFSGEPAPQGVKEATVSVRKSPLENRSGRPAWDKIAETHIPTAKVLPRPFDTLDRNNKLLTLSPGELDRYEEAILVELRHRTRPETATFLTILMTNGRGTSDYYLAAYSLLMLVGLPLEIFIVDKKEDHALLSDAVMKWFERMRELVPQDARAEASSGNKEKSNCFIATAACGSVNALDVIVLRQFRDRSLQGNALGRLFIGFYERHSPALAAQIANCPPARWIVRWFLIWPVARAVRYAISKRQK
jgi:hypothetical protein